MYDDGCPCHFYFLLGLRGLYRGQWPQGHGSMLLYDIYIAWPGGSGRSW